jgi:hypothetical protein
LNEFYYLDTALCDKIGQLLAAGRWFYLGIPVSSTNKTDGHDITEILLKVQLDTITLTLTSTLHYLVHFFPVFVTPIFIDN